MTIAWMSLVLILAAAPTRLSVLNKSCTARSGSDPYVHIRGRLSVYNGGYPNLRLWQIHTHHLFGIYSDPADLQCAADGKCNVEEETKLPGNLEQLMADPNSVFDIEVYGDFKIRLLEPRKEGHMQAACIVSAQRLVRRRRSD